MSDEKTIKEQQASKNNSLGTLTKQNSRKKLYLTTINLSSTYWKPLHKVTAL